MYYVICLYQLTSAIFWALMSTSFWPLNHVKAREEESKFPLTVRDETRSKGRTHNMSKTGKKGKCLVTTSTKFFGYILLVLLVPLL